MLRFFGLPILVIAALSLPANARPRTVDCLLEVGGRAYIDGPCDMSSEKDGSFYLGRKDASYFAYVEVNTITGTAAGTWNEGARHANTLLGELYKKGACWSNDKAKVCAWQVGEPRAIHQDEIAPQKNIETAIPSLPHKFISYPSGPIFRGHSVSPNLLTRDAYQYRTRLRDAAQQPANFASYWRLELWGCGTQCLTGAAVNLANGSVVFLPFSVCCSARLAEPDFSPVGFRADSRLIVFSGLRNEEGEDKSHFYDFNGQTFTYLSSSNGSDGVEK